MNLTVSFGSDKYTSIATALNLYRVKPVFGDLLNILCPDHKESPCYRLLARADCIAVRQRRTTLGRWKPKRHRSMMLGSPPFKHILKNSIPGNGQEVMKYLEAYSNDVWWSNGLRCPVYPFDVCNITQIVDRPASAGKIHPDWGQYWGKVQTVKYDPNNVPNIEALPILFAVQSVRYES